MRCTAILTNTHRHGPALHNVRIGVVFRSYYALALLCCVFFFNDTATTEIYTLSLHDALPISQQDIVAQFVGPGRDCFPAFRSLRSEEHTSELQSPCNLVCRLLLEKKKTI